MKRLEESSGTCRNTLWTLVHIYSETGRMHNATNYMHKILEISKNDDEKASYLMGFGQLMEQSGDFLSAEKYYRKAIDQNPSNDNTRYFIHNNLGYCLNQQRRFKEAAQYLKVALDINPYEANAYKNMGLCLQRLEKHSKAAEYFIMATKINASDSRSLNHLQDLIQEHPEIIADIPDIYEQIEMCERVVETVEENQPDPYIQWRKL
ncbi:MAG: tetratricopeptide repeat protein, partial [Deltaproteobacteria bacterium]|nr:tetratricopeptide repeat protein [Deltaproteobacteria bacterium]